ncbi:hypothetical protein SUGI_1170820 [Cryptomeria japonica]|nr:hypothetical protein SUGI_1170820 [Cryptomeria japonica]
MKCRTPKQRERGGHSITRQVHMQRRPVGIAHFGSCTMRRNARWTCLTLHSTGKNHTTKETDTYLAGNRISGEQSSQLKPIG